MTCIHKSYDESKIEDRRKVVAGAIASQRLEGLELDQDTLSDLKSFSDGDSDLAEIRAKIEARFSNVEKSISFDI